MTAERDAARCEGTCSRGWPCVFEIGHNDDSPLGHAGQGCCDSPAIVAGLSAWHEAHELPRPIVHAVVVVR